MEDAAPEPSALGAASQEAEVNDVAAASDAAPANETQAEASEQPSAVAVSDGPPSSNGMDAQVALQLRAWKERALRMEQLLNKKSARIQELEETEAKLKRLLAMAKRSIDNSKQDVSEKDQTIQRLREEVEKSSQARHTWFTDAETREPRKIVYKVRHGALFWCFVEYANENDLDETKEYAWHCFNNDEEIKAYANRASGEPLKLPELSLTPYEVERVKKGLKEDVDRVQEEFRRYRVRSEITRKQKDAEIRKMSANVLARQTEQISETDVAGELQAAKAQIRRLTKSQTEAEEKETEWRRKFEKLLRDYEKLSGTMGETVLATEWRERYEQSVREKEELEKKLEDLKLSTNSMMMGATGGSGGGSELQSLRQEFAQYRKRAMNAVEQKEKELSDMHAQYGDSGPSRAGSGGARALNGFSSASMRRMSTDSSSSLSGFDTPHASTTNEYLRNIVYKYMTTDQNEAKEHMEKAIATVLNFTPAEVTAIQEKRKAQGWFW